jgi:hypothetical protein
LLIPQARRTIYGVGLCATIAAFLGCALPGTTPSGAAAGRASVVERLEVLQRTPAFRGARFGEAGEYELVSAVAHMKIDPQHPANAQIADLALAADADGAVRYRTDVITATSFRSATPPSPTRSPAAPTASSRSARQARLARS